MDVVRQTADFAENQTKFFIKDINSQDNGTRLKAIKRYKEYISTYHPEMYDDDVDFLYTGNSEHHGIRTMGLLHGCGQQSSKHEGQLKRIAANLLIFLQWLLSIECAQDVENIFFERFIRLPAGELVQMCLWKHISLDNTRILVGAGQRGGNTEIACEILSILMQYHVNEDGKPDPLDIDYMLNNDNTSKEYFMKWLEHSANKDAMEAVASRSEAVSSNERLTFADTWEDVHLSYVPLQPDEAGYGGEEEIDSNELDNIIPDPLGLTKIDLRSIMVHSTSASKMKSQSDSSSTKKKRMTVSASKMSLIQRIKNKKSRKAMEKTTDEPSDEAVAPSEEVDQKNNDTNTGCIDISDHEVSVIPSQKNFSPAAFLSYVHGYTTYQKLHAGLKNLEVRLAQQSSRREDLVRQNFGPFICCVDGLAWLKDFQGLSNKFGVQSTTKKAKKSSVSRSRVSFSVPSTSNSPPVQLGEMEATTSEYGCNGLSRATIHLEKAKEEAQNILAPILSRMKRSRQLKNADQMLRRLASFMEYPHAMTQLLNKGDYESVLNIYHRVESLPATSNLRILKRITVKAKSVMEDMKQKLISTLMMPQPVLPIIVRHMKLLGEVESDDSCRNILQKCFEKQIQCFDEHIKNIATGLHDSLTAAFMKGQEINLNNKGSDKLPHERRSSFFKGPQVTRADTHRRRKGRAMTILSTAHRSFMENIGAEYSVLRAENGDKELELSFDNFDSFPEDAYIEADKDSDSSSISSIDSKSTMDDNHSLRHLFGDDFVKNFIDDDPSVDYAELLCNRVRVRDVSKMVDCVNEWLPSVHKCIQMLRIYGSAQPTPTPAQKRLTSFNNNLSRSYNKNSSVAYGKNQAVSAETKKVGNALTICGDFLQAIVLGTSSVFAGQSTAQKSESSTSEINMLDCIGPAFHSMFQWPMNEPFLSECVMEVSELFEAVETILSSGEGVPGVMSPPTADEPDSMNFFGSSSYREAVLHIKSVAHDGENAVASKALEQLVSQALMLTSSVSKDISPKKKVRDIDETIRIFENLTSKHLQYLVSVVRCPPWISKLVWENVQKVLDRFISSLALMSASVESLSDQKHADPGQPKANAASSESMAATRLELENLEVSLLNTQHIQLAKNKSLEFIKGCVRLRTVTVQKIWNETQAIFPIISSVYGPGTIFRQGNTLVDMTPDKRGSGSEHRRPSGVQIKMEDKISLSVGSILVLEENAVDKYLEFVLLNFRTNAHASYSVIVKNEMTSDHEKSYFHQRGLPTHISRILLDLGHIQSSLHEVLAGMTVSSDEDWKNGAAYEDYLFHLICISVVSVFTDLVDSLANNAFSLHSTGRKYVSRRLSCSFSPSNRSITHLQAEEDDDNVSFDQQCYKKCKYPLSCGQALEELEFFKSALSPLLLTDNTYPENVWVHDHSDSSVGSMYLSREKLLQESLLFVETLRNKSSSKKGVTS